ncbi:MAG: metal-dependent hydrolase [Natronomonas sp.]
MPSTVVHTAFALLIAAALLDVVDRRVFAVVVVALLFPELDTVAGWYMDGAHRALLHNVVVTAIAAAVLYWETNREESWLRDRVGDRGVWVGWVVLFAHTVAHLGLDWAHLEGINVFYPVYDRFFRLEGEMYLSTTEGLVQTFVEFEETTAADGTADVEVDVGAGGTTADTHVGNPAEPSETPDDDVVDRRFPIAVQGWQLYLIASSAFVLLARRLQTPLDTEE